MKKWMVFSVFMMVLVLAACGNEANDSPQNDQVVSGTADEKAVTLKLLESETTGRYLADSKGHFIFSRMINQEKAIAWVIV
jgi:protein involved in sex pheromone biosynthesis